MESTIWGSQLSPEEERNIIRDLSLASETQIKLGDSFYLISQRWWQHWVTYVNEDMSSVTNAGSSLYDSEQHKSSFDTPMRPLSIDNSELIYDIASEDSDVQIELHDTLVEGRDYALLPSNVWLQLHSWYGGGPILERKVIDSGSSQTELAIEVYPLRLHLLLVPNGVHSVLRISRKGTIRELHTRVCEIFDLTEDQLCIWDYYGHRKHALMNQMDKTLDDANIQMDQDILIEMICNNNGYMSSRQENGSGGKESISIPLEACKSTLSIPVQFNTCKDISQSCSSELSQNQPLDSPVSDLDNSYGSTVMNRSSRGLTGLLNLGNTCFMNSAIQCLVHTPEFARYFREDYLQEINRQNPLGMVGELAVAFGELLRKLWSPGRTPISPRPFKAKLARFAPQFSGYNQHDSQELLAFLLDGLHEDLNRVKLKPYVETKDADGRPDKEVADEYWANHIARNDSIIVDVCQGQYKSTLVCPVCGKVSVTFDPFMYLSLPLQFATTRTMTVTVFTSDGSALPRSYTVTVPKQGRCRDLIQALSSACHLRNGEKLLLAEINDHFIHQIFNDLLIPLSTIKDSDHLAAYKVQKSSKDPILLHLIHRQEVTDSCHASDSVAWRTFGTPLVAAIPRDSITRENVYTMVQGMLSPFLRISIIQHFNISSKKLNSAYKLSHDMMSSDVEPRDDSEENTDDMPSNSQIKDESCRLSLQLVDENNACIDLCMDEEKMIVIPSSTTSIIVYNDWTKKALRNYDPQYLENLPEVHKYGGSLGRKCRTEPLSLYACLDAFLREEPLVPEDMWYCPQCKEQRQASKKLDLWRLPKVLVIHLKRFSYSRSMKHKLETFVNFPIHDLDLTNYVAPKNGGRRQLYELYALSNHYGGMGSGHYTAHIKLLDENRWYNFDDSHISLINEEDVKSAAAYVLFYRRSKVEDDPSTNGVCMNENNIMK